MRRGRTPCCDKIGLKKGPWAPEEDARLKAFIQKFGHGNWRTLPKQAGLLRCGKSCRLRWTNYLRPDIKLGNFTPEEEDAIFKLHEKLGNKWSKIASQLPGRTDNEIKNLWHTHLKKKLISKESKLPNTSKDEPSSSSSSSSSPFYHSCDDRRKRFEESIKVSHFGNSNEVCKIAFSDEKFEDKFEYQLSEASEILKLDLWNLLDDNDDNDVGSKSCEESEKLLSIPCWSDSEGNTIGIQPSVLGDLEICNIKSIERENCREDTVEIPMEPNIDLCDILSDDFTLFSSIMGETEEDKLHQGKTIVDTEESEIKKWITYLENELELCTNSDSPKSELVKSFEPRILLPSHDEEMEVQIDPMSTYQHLWPTFNSVHHKLSLP